MRKIGRMQAMCSLFIASVAANSACMFWLYQDDIEEVEEVYAISRWSAAYGTAIDIVKCLKNNSVGSLSEFTNQHSCFDGSFTLGNVIYYAEQVGIQNDPSYRTRLNKVWSGNSTDPI